jgi:hypothetical protein
MRRISLGGKNNETIFLFLFSRRPLIDAFPTSGIALPQIR